MSIYTPQDTEVETTAMPNCLCGENGRVRNERECFRRGGCKGCGFDRDEHMRRLEILRENGLRPLTSARRSILLQEWSVNPNWELFGLRVGKKKRTAKSED